MNWFVSSLCILAIYSIIADIHSICWSLCRGRCGVDKVWRLKGTWWVLVTMSMHGSKGGRQDSNLMGFYSQLASCKPPASTSMTSTPAWPPGSAIPCLTRAEPPQRLLRAATAQERNTDPFTSVRFGPVEKCSSRSRSIGTLYPLVVQVYLPFTHHKHRPCKSISTLA